MSKTMTLAEVVEEMKTAGDAELAALAAHKLEDLLKAWERLRAVRPILIAAVDAIGGGFTNEQGQYVVDKSAVDAALAAIGGEG